jgi:hypothetical protein
LAQSLALVRTLPPRIVAAVAGQLVSMSLGLRLSRTLVRLLYHIVIQARDWDSHISNTPPFSALMLFIVKNVEQLNGRRWDAHPVTLEVHVDASDTGVGMWFSTPNGERQWRCVYEFSDELKALVAANLAHSTGREAFGYFLVPRFVADNPELRELASGGTVAGAVSRKLMYYVHVLNDAINNKQLFDHNKI